MQSFNIDIYGWWDLQYNKISVDCKLTETSPSISKELEIELDLIGVSRTPMQKFKCLKTLIYNTECLVQNLLEETNEMDTYSKNK